MTVEVLEDGGAATARAATFIAGRIRGSRDAVIGLPTGRTMVPVYDRLVVEPIDWSGIRTFNVDEFAGTAPDHAGSFRAFMDRHLFSRVPLAPAVIGFPRGDTGDLEAECARYEAAVTAAGGLDLLVLGIGANGHVGFNEPGETLHAATHVAALSEATRRANAELFGGEWRRVPSQALTIGMGHVLRAREILVVATGASKAQAVRAMVRGPLTTRCPASWLQVHGRATVVLDAAAAGAL
ncbi:MAG: glucosamine-6-phosphate deaminase [Vicinamibacterales bacterium]